MAVEIDLTEVDRVVASYGGEPQAVIPILQDLQDHYGFLPEAALERVCETSQITPAAITGVATFYAQFRHRPGGRHRIKVCVGTACHVMGAEMIDEAFRDHLEIAKGEDTDQDRLFTVDKVACIGCCMLAPAVQIDEVTYGYVTTSGVPNLKRDFLASTESVADEAKPKKSNGRRPRGEISMCLCSSCSASGAKAVHAALESEISELGLPAAIKIVGCNGVAYQSPMLEVGMSNGETFSYGRVSPEELRRILSLHFKPVSLGRRISATVNRGLDRLLTDTTWQPVTRYAVDLRNGPDAAFTGAQHHISTEHCGQMAPLDVEEYEATGGFKALRRCLVELTPEAIREEVESSGLRGRGGAGFPTARKWNLVASAEADERYVICNGDEGDPGAFMDRMLLESFPLRVIEGMVIAARAVGASNGFFYIRAEYPLALERIRQGLELMLERGLVGENILGTGINFTVDVVAGAGAFVCGEETALIAAIEGRRGTPTPRPPYPAESGLWNKPTLVNNVETMALVPAIMREGGAVFSDVGTGSSRGTKAFALAGKIRRSGLVEVPMGTTLRQIVDEIGGGVRDGHTLKAIQVGGPSGGCVPASLADTPVDYESLRSAGAMMGSGGMVVLDDSDCMVEMARYFMAFTQDESCGRCTFCRVGTKRMLEILERLCSGRGKARDLVKLEELAKTVGPGSLCGLGQTAPNPVLSTLRHFREEYDAHVAGRCPAARCRDMISYSINDMCIGCTLCAQHCPSGSIIAKPYKLHVVDMETCVRCDACVQVCPTDAVDVF